MPLAVDRFLAYFRTPAPKPTASKPPAPPALHYSPNIITDNRLRVLAGYPPIQRGRYAGDDRSASLGPTGERAGTWER